MKKSIRKFASLIIVLIMVAAWNISSVASYTVLTPPIILKSNNILDQELIQGKNYTIKENVVNDGIINKYHLTTHYGEFDVESTSVLVKRINELNALVAMEALERSGVFKNSLVKGVKAPVKGAVQLIKSPIETTKGAVTGAGKFLSNMGRSIVSSDPHQDNVLKVALGYDAAKRAYAYEFGIDPYSSFSPVTNRLGQIARAAVAGGLIPRATMVAIDNDVVTFMQITAATKNLKKLVRDNSPGDLNKINKKKLEKLEIPSPQIESFLSNYYYNPQEKTMLVGALEQMDNVQGLDIFIAAADTAMENNDALLYRLIAQMMAGYHTRIKPAKQIVSIDGTLHLKTNDNTLILTAPADFIFKTGKVISKLANLDDKIRSMTNVNGKELWITGNIDNPALELFEAAGWNVTVNSNNFFNKDD